MQKFLLLIIALSSIKIGESQNKYFVYFTDKHHVEFNPYTYFDKKALDRRVKNGIALNDSTDYPVNSFYAHAVENLSDSVGIVSRWLNGMSIYATDNDIMEIKKYPFIKNIQLLNSETILLANNNEEEQKAILNPTDFNLLQFQTARHKGYEFAKRNISGKGVRIAIFDIGFPNVDTHPAFEHLRNANHIIATYDFIKKKDFVYYSMSHGTMVLSCIAGYYDTIAMGMAPDAEFLLAKTERQYSEKEIEEDNWLAAAEWADKNGADIISSSLAYTKQRYVISDMNGNASIVAKAAEMAFSKGILVINAAGNEGNDKWEYIATPADAEDVLTVGGTDPYTDAHIYFSSYGPTADGRLKPNVCSLGEAIVASKTGYVKEQGTSFATPLVAGFAACVLQNNPELKNTELFDIMQQCAHLYPYYDYAHGYGIPQADKVLGLQKKKENFKTFDIDTAKNTATSMYITLANDWYPDSLNNAKVQPRNFYYEFIDDAGKIAYFGVEVPDNKILEIQIPYAIAYNELTYNFKAHFEGYTFTMKLHK